MAAAAAAAASKESEGAGGTRSLGAGREGEKAKMSGGVCDVYVSDRCKDKIMPAP
jgi:hypothetical protein